MFTSMLLPKWNYFNRENVMIDQRKAVTFVMVKIEILLTIIGINKTIKLDI